MKFNTQPLAVMLGVIGTLFIMAMAFDLMPGKIAIFAAIACYVLAAAVKRLAKP
ncbi:MAG: hypothetical protein HY231_10535 [Acidobacteria bacterium]|nr:hypothetical protein [Acidobacteriota bacterium]